MTPFYEKWPGESGNVPLLPGLFYFAEKINRANYGGFVQSMGVIVLTMGNRANYGGNRAKIVFGSLNHSNSRG